jgi:hypothetical protein
MIPIKQRLEMAEQMVIRAGMLTEFVRLYENFRRQHSITVSLNKTAQYMNLEF